MLGLQDTNGVPNVGTAVAIAPGQPGLTRLLGRASYAVDGPSPGTVWLVVDPEFPDPRAADSGCTVEEVQVSGAVTVGARPLPCGWQVEGSAPDGLLVDRESLQPSGSGAMPVSLSTWNPRTGRLGRNYAFASDDGGIEFSIDGDEAGESLWNECGSQPCVERVTDLASGRTAVLPGMPSGWVQLSRYALSPDGSFAAVIAVSDATQSALDNSGLSDRSTPCCYFGVHPVPSELLLYDLRTAALVEARPLLAASVVVLDWSPDGGWLFATRDLQHIEAVPMWSDSQPLKVLPTGRTRPFGPDDPAESFVPYVH